MKKVYVLACAVLLAGSVSAQGILPMQPVKSQDFRSFAPANTPSNQQVEREVFWTNDLSDPADWTIDNALNNGFEQFVDLQFQIGTGLAPSGFAPIAAINSTTYDNGIAMVDSDLYGGEEGGLGIENCWIQTANPIDCSAHPYVGISFETFYRMWDGGSSDGNEYCLVEVSTDGVNWPDASTFEVSEAPGERWELWPNMQTQDPVTNPTNMFFDITSAAGGQSTVYLRFRWKGTWGYAWMIDDIQLFDLAANDVRVASTTYSDYNNTGILEYGVFPFSQLTELTFRSDVENIGATGQTGVTMDVTVNGSNVGTSAAEDIAYGEADSLFVTGYTPPATAGDYAIEYSVTTAEGDENPGDNMASQSFMVDEWQMGRDDNGFTGVFPLDGADEFILGPVFQIFNDATVYAIDVAIMNTSDAGTELIAEMRDYNSENFDVLVASSEQPIVSSLLNDGSSEPLWTTFVLEDPMDVFAGDIVYPTIQHYGGSAVQIGESRNAPEQTCFLYGDFGTAGFAWYFTTDVPMVRLNFNPDATVGVEDALTAPNFTLLQNFPNPADDVTRVNYELTTAGRVNIAVYDITGKQVMNVEEGLLPAGTHRTVLNVAALPAGVYHYTLTVGENQLSRKMVIQ